MPETGTYQIVAFGAQGGPVGFVAVGGRGAEIGGDFSLTAGETLQIAVGGAGMSGGGGGGSFVVGPGNTPLVIAGGGGGGGFTPFGNMGFPGQGGLTGPDGGAGAIINGVPNGGTGGNGGGGAVGRGSGGGGGGFFSAGGNGAGVLAGTGGGAFPELTGGAVGGGFGGGGGAGDAGGGGGGGYSGGGGSANLFGGVAGGGGGGSFNAGTDQISVANLQTGNGEVVILKVSPSFAGTPGKANCRGKSISALVKQYGGLNAAATELGFDSVKALQQSIEEFCEA